MNPPPIFILGCDRSGTSLLRRILDSHSKIACPTETKFIYQFVKVYETCQSVAGLRSMGFSDDDILNRMKTFISGFLDEYSKQNKKIRWAEKTTHNVNCLFTIDKIFSQTPLYLAIVRHGLDVAYSMTKVTHHPFTVLEKYRYDQADTAVAAIRHWNVMNRKIIDFAGHAEKRLLWIKYEHLTQHPEDTLNKVFDFIREPFEKQVLDYNQKNHNNSRWDDPSATKHKKIIKNSNNYKKWPKASQDYLYDIGKVLLNHFEYKL